MDREAEVWFWITVDGKIKMLHINYILVSDNIDQSPLITTRPIIFSSKVTVSTFQLYSQFHYNSCFENANSQNGVISPWHKFLIWLCIILHVRSNRWTQKTIRNWIKLYRNTGNLYTYNPPQTSTNYFSLPHMLRITPIHIWCHRFLTEFR